MNGVALALSLATLGVDYSYRTTEEGQLEYTIQIEPEFLQSLAEGEEIHSDVPPEAGQVERICVRIGTTPVRHTAASIQQFKRLLVAAPRFASSDPALAGGEAQRTIVWPSRANPEESFGASYGWQPDQQGQLSYFVQIDATTLKTLAAGDEIHASIDPAAGRVGRFVISSGNKPLPRIAPPPAEVASIAPPSAKSRTRFQTGDDAGASPAATLPPAGAFRPSDYGPQGTNSPAVVSGAPDAYSPAQPRFNTSREPVASDLRAPATAPRTGGYTGEGTLLDVPPRSDFNQPPAARPPAAYSPSEPVLVDPRGYNPAPQPASAPRFDQYRNNTLQPQVDIAPAPNYVQPGTAEHPPYQQPTTRYSPPVANDRVASLPAGAAASNSTGIPVATNPAGLAATTSEPGSLSGSPTGLMWLVAMFLLFLSIGGNLYLGWTAAEFYSRYRLAVDRLRTAGRA
jgi:hypothetical protein